ncbi:MAG: hypothetical protein LBT65_02220 [Synergistaceae bacterium]|nr:hypothetical protein [Synergistaceae bacterium]
MKYPALIVRKQDGSERIECADKEVRLSDYWSWAHSDLNSNAERGKFAEYLVSLAMRCADGISEEWSAYDILTHEGIKIEIKTSAYLQTWAHKELSIIRFNIAPSHAWDSKTNRFDAEYKRQSDIYVFCVENHQNQSTLNPLDLDQWDFYPLLTSVLDKAVADQKTISIQGVQKLGATRHAFSALREAILSLATQERE